MVFILPPWKQIYKQDECRYETFEESIKIYQEIIEIYHFFKNEDNNFRKGFSR